ncbi:MAG: M16 family metallopeptidase [Myxococcota bacterium]
MIFTLLSIAQAETPMQIHSWTLENNDTVILVEDHRVPLALVNTRFTIGSLTPWFEENHGDEAFEILYYDAEQDLAQRSNALAASLSASCGTMVCKSALTLLKEDLDSGVQLYKDLLNNTNIDLKELGRWKKSQKIDWESQLKEPDFIGYRALMAELYVDPTDARRQGYEKPDDVNEDVPTLNSTAQSIIQKPGRIIGLAGDITKEEAVAIVEGLLPESNDTVDGRTANMTKPRTVADGRPKTQVATMPNLTQVYFYYYRDGLAFNDPNFPAYRLANHVIGGHFYSRLYSALRHEEGDTYGVSASSTAYPKDPGAYVVKTFTRTDNQKSVEDKLIAVLQKYSDEGMTAEELEEAKSNMVGRRKRAQSSPMGVLGDLATNQLYGLPLDFDDIVVQQALELDLETVNAFIKDFYNPEAYTMLKVVNEE